MSEPVPEAEAPKRTYLPDDPNWITHLLSQNKVWVTRKRGPENVWELSRGHLENIISWLDGQVVHILDVLGIETDALTAPAMHQWLHEQPLVKALDAALIRQRRIEEAEPPQGMAPTGWLLKPMVAIDIESTGIDIEHDRMVSFSIGTSQSPADGAWESITQLVDPGIEIPEEASRIHGITTERARAEGISEEAAIGALVRSLLSLQSVPVVAYNARFDLTILDRTCRRHTGKGLPPLYVLDPFVLDRAIDPYRKGKRTLAAVCDHYRVGKRIVHDADEDAQRTIRLLWMLMTSPAAKQFFQGQMPDLDQMMEVQRDAYEAQSQDMAQWQARTGRVPDVKDTWWPIARLPGNGMEKA